MEINCAHNQRNIGTIYKIPCKAMEKLISYGNLCDAAGYSSTDHQMKLLSSCTPSNLRWLHDLALSIAV